MNDIFKDEEQVKNIELITKSLRSLPGYHKDFLMNPSDFLVEGMLRPAEIIDGKEIGIEVYVDKEWKRIA